MSLDLKRTTGVTKLQTSRSLDGFFFTTVSTISQPNDGGGPPRIALKAYMYLMEYYHGVDYND